MPSTPRATRKPAEPAAEAAGRTASIHSGAEQIEELRIIRFKTLQLCELIVASAPHSKRLESALGSIRSGVRLAIEEIEGFGARRAEIAKLPKDRDA